MTAEAEFRCWWCGAELDLEAKAREAGIHVAAARALAERAGACACGPCWVKEMPRRRWIEPAPRMFMAPRKDKEARR